jgi:hypothetical protein
MIKPRNRGKIRYYAKCSGFSGNDFETFNLFSANRYMNHKGFVLIYVAMQLPKLSCAYSLAREEAQW